MYYGIGPEQGKIIEEDQAFDYALERCLKGTLEDQKEFREMLVEWFYSGNWIETDDTQRYEGDQGMNW